MIRLAGWTVIKRILHILKISLNRIYEGSPFHRQALEGDLADDAVPFMPHAKALLGTNEVTTKATAIH
jgi:hypothetical protein